MTLQDRLARARADKKMSMARVAKALDLSAWQAVQQWEKGRAKPSRDNLDRLAALYGKPIEYFLHGTLPARAKPALIGPSPIAMRVASAFDGLTKANQALILQMLDALHAEPVETTPGALEPHKP
jgi:transcriptional regulator with XRE-family HTH domain